MNAIDTERMLAGIAQYKQEKAARRHATPLPSEPRKPRVPKDAAIVLKAVSDQYGVSAHDILNGTREHKNTKPRQVATFLIREIQFADQAKYSYPEIGRMFKAHHTSVLYSVQITEERLQTDVVLQWQVEKLRKALKGYGQ